MLGCDCGAVVIAGRRLGDKESAAVTRQIHFNAFEMNCLGHQLPGLWSRPRDRSGHGSSFQGGPARNLRRRVAMAGLLARASPPCADLPGFPVVMNGTRLAAHSCRRGHGLGPLWVVRTVFPINPLDSIRRGTIDRGSITPSPSAVKPDCRPLRARLRHRLLSDGDASAHRPRARSDAPPPRAPRR
jgi:hypothetical protein